MADVHDETLRVRISGDDLARLDGVASRLTEEGLGYHRFTRSDVARKAILEWLAREAIEDRADKPGGGSLGDQGRADLAARLEVATRRKGPVPGSRRCRKHEKCRRLEGHPDQCTGGTLRR